MQRNRKLLKDFIFVLSIILAVIIFRAQYLQQAPILSGQVLELAYPLGVVAVFLAGMLFTSFLTVSLATATLFVLAKDFNPLTMAVIGGSGAMITDLLLVKIFRKVNLKELPLVGITSAIVNAIFTFYNLNLEFLYKVWPKKLIVKILLFLRSSFVLSWVLPFLGALIIASPFPDEIGLAFLGVSKISYLKVAVIAFLFNSLGILSIALISKAL